MINIFAISVLFTRQSFQVSPRGLGASGLEIRPEFRVSFSGTFNIGSGINDPVRVSSNVFDSKVEAKNFISFLNGGFRFINGNDHIETVVNAITNKIGLSGFGEFDPIKSLGLILSENDRDSNPSVPESETNRFCSIEGP